jgi:alkylation response protein AidB-like acyl-CoA dehydrogenase
LETVSRPPSEALATAAEVAARFAERAAEADRLGALPAADVADLRASGLLRLAAPRSFGGAEARLEEAVAVQAVLAGGSAATALVAAMTLMLVGHARDVEAWADERDRLFGLVQDGALLNAVASEPALGSPARGGLPATELRRDGAGWRLFGHKTWATGGEHLTHLLVRAREGDRAVQALVANHAEGVRWTRTWGDGLSLRGSDSHDVRFDGVRVDDRDLLRLRPGPEARNVWFPLLVTATYLGAARAARDAVVAYGRARVPTALGHPIADLPSFRRDLGALQVRLHAADATLVAAARAWDTRRSTVDAEVAKLVGVEAAAYATETALRLAGAAGLGADLTLERHFRDVRAGFAHPPAADAVYARQASRLLDLDGHGDGVAT